MQERTSIELAEYAGGRVSGDPDVRIKSAVKQKIAVSLMRQRSMPR